MNFMNDNSYDPLAHPDAQLVNVLYCTPVGRLMEMDKERLREALNKTRLVCHWLQGILNLLREQEREQSGTLSLKPITCAYTITPSSKGDQ